MQLYHIIIISLCGSLLKLIELAFGSCCSDGNADKDLYTLTEVDFSLKDGETLLVSPTFYNFCLDELQE